MQAEGGGGRGRAGEGGLVTSYYAHVLGTREVLTKKRKREDVKKELFVLLAQHEERK